MRFPRDGPMGRPLQPDLPPLNLTAESAGTQEPATLTPQTSSKEKTPSAGELLQQGWGGPADPNPAFPIMTEVTPPTASSAPVILGEIPTAEPEENKEMEEATS